MNKGTVLGVFAATILCVAGAFFFLQNKPTTSMPQNKTDVFKEFFLELHKRALINDSSFFEELYSDTDLEILKKLNRTREDMIQRDIQALKDVEIDSFKYQCNENICNAEGLWKKDPKFPNEDLGKVMFQYTLINGQWTTVNDQLPTLEQISDLEMLVNDYQVSYYGKGKATFKVLVNGVVAKESIMENPQGTTLNFLIYVKPGKNNMVIEITPNEPSAEVTYSYEIDEFPKGVDQYAIFDDQYLLFTSKPPGEITGFIKTILTKQLSIPFEIEAK